MVTAVKSKFGYDDSLDAFGVHGAGGTLGAILTGVFATKAVNDVLSGKPMGWVDGNAGAVAESAIGVPDRHGCWHGGNLDHPEDLRRDSGRARHSKEEIEGLDLSMHGEEGYNFEA
jgi:Amt family ammonium transporter